MGGGFAIVTAAALAYFAAHGALGDLRLATIDYNLRYSAETYAGRSVIAYPLVMLTERMHVDALWFLGGLGAVLVGLRWRRHATQWVWLWLAAAVISIGVNGARDLPQYFIQANPALALAAAAGLVSLRRQRRWIQAIAAVVLVAGLWRVGDETYPWWQPRCCGIPEAAGNVAQDLALLRGQISRTDFLARFGGAGPRDKYSALAVDELATRAHAMSTPSDSIFVFGFSSGGVYVKSERRSASRFFWSRPVEIEFAADHPGYGSAGLLSDLRRDPPALVALQRHDWGILATVKADGRPAEQNSYDFFMTNGPLRAWLEAGYVHEDSTPEFDIWRRRS
jgi:hypothetical protein